MEQHARTEQTRSMGRPRDGGDYCPQLKRVASPWSVNGDGAISREVTAIEETETMPAPKSTPQIEGVAPTRKRTRRAKASQPAEADGVIKVLTFRTTRAQADAVDRWRSGYAGLDLSAALRTLVALGLATHPHTVVDPLAVATATHMRVRRPRTAKT